MDRRGGTWKLLGTVVYAHRQELITTLYIGFLVLIFSSFVVYMVEKDYNENFASFAHALWWGVITLCTVGYGDSVPVTWKGKIMASFCAICGISFFALPAGILGSGFALKVQQQQRQKHMNRRKVPAATLIQCLWRCYAADENSSSEATWKMHLIPQRSPPFKNQTSSFTSRLPNLRRKGTSDKSTGRSPRQSCKHKHQHTHSDQNYESMSNTCEETETASVRKINETKSVKRTLSRSSNLGRTRSLSPNPSRNPSVSPSRIPSQNPSPHGSKVQSRSSSPFPWCKVTNFNATLPTAPDRLDSNDPALPLVLCSLLQREFAMKSPGRGRKSVYKDEQEDEEEDEDYGVPFTLTTQHKGAIRVIRKLKYMAARRKFKEALRPYDVKDVIESYSAGHADLVVKVKGIQSRLDMILGKQGINKKDAYESKTTLASRIVNTERQVDMIEEKLQIFINMYEEDRKRLHALTYAVPHPPPSTPCPDTPMSNISPPAPANSNTFVINPYSSISTGLHKLPSGPSAPLLRQKSVLACEHQASVPASPDCDASDRRGMLKKGKNPFRKRVTLGSIPSRLTRVDSDTVGESESSVRVRTSTMVPPSVTVQGCTPPSEQDSLDGELKKYFKGVS